MDTNNFSSSLYWESRYRSGGNSGAGSYDRLAAFKADVINAFVAEMGIDSVIEFGAGDGNQLLLYNFPEYSGFDVSMTAVAMLREKFPDDTTKHFFPMSEFAGQTAALSLSCDVIYHLIEDDVYDAYMRALFQAAGRFVIAYSSNTDAEPYQRGSHVRHRKFTAWTTRNAPAWECFRHVKNEYPGSFSYHSPRHSFCDFFFFRKKSRAGV